MVLSRTFNRELRFMVDREMELDIHALMAKEDKKKNEMCRELLMEAIERRKAEDSIDHLLLLVRQVIKDELRTSEDRLAAINAKTSIASATSMYMLYQVIHDMGLKNPQVIYEEARKKGVNYIRTPVRDLNDEHS